MNLAAAFRRLTEKANPGRDGRGRRYSDSARELATRYCREQRKTGRPLTKIARELGINVATLGRWLEAAPRNDNGVSFREVAVVEEAGESVATSIRLTLPSGVRIDGLRRGDLIELVKALA